MAANWIVQQVANPALYLSRTKGWVRYEECDTFSDDEQLGQLELSRWMRLDRCKEVQVFCPECGGVATRFLDIQMDFCDVCDSTLVAKYTPHHREQAEGHIVLPRSGAMCINLAGAASMSQEELDVFGNIFAEAVNATYAAQRERKQASGRFATICWTVADVQSLFSVSDDEAAEFLQNNESQIQCRTIELGWDVLRTLGEMDGLQPVGEEQAPAAVKKQDDEEEARLYGVVWSSRTCELAQTGYVFATVEAARQAGIRGCRWFCDSQGMDIREAVGVQVDWTSDSDIEPVSFFVDHAEDKYAEYDLDGNKIEGGDQLG